MSRWFRLYEDLVDDPKVQRLPLDHFRALINLWCLASRNGGCLPPVGDIAFSLRLPEKQASATIAALRLAGFIDDDETGSRPHNWRSRQFKSDVSNDRVRRHRQRQRNVTSSVSGTPPEAETEAETEAAQQFVEGRADRDRFEVELRDALGDRQPPETADFSPILGLIDAGYDPVKDILPVVRSRAKSAETIGSWRYFVPAIEEAKAAKSAIRKPAAGKPASEPTAWLTQDDPRWSAVAAVAQAKRGKPLLAAGSAHAPGLGAFVPMSWLAPPPTAGPPFDDLAIPEMLRRSA